MKGKRTELLVLLIPLALLGATGVLYATVLGPGSSYDSVTYVGAARSLLQGRGYLTLAYDGGLEPMTHYPPLYPTLLAVPGLWGVDPLVGARWLAALCMAVNVLLAGAAVYQFSRGALWAAAIAALLTLASAAVEMVHAWAWAEPSFLILTLFALMQLDRYVARGRRAALWLAGVCVGLACLARYTGLTLLATALLWVLGAGPGTLKRRIADALLLVALGGVPLGLWFVRNLVVSGGLANRQIAYHPATREQLLLGLRTIAGWVWAESTAPVWAGGALVAVYALICVGGAAWLRRRMAGTDATERAPLLAGLFVLVYGVALLASIWFVDAHTPLDDRILVPVFVGGLVCIWSMLGALLKDGPRGAIAALLVLGLALMGVSGMRNWAYVRYLHTDGAGYAAVDWTHSALMEQVRALPPETPLVSNVPDSIYILTGRPAAWLPYEVHAGTRQPNQALVVELEALAADYAARDGRLVYFSQGAWRWYLPTLETLKRELQLQTVGSADDGEILSFVGGR